MALSRRNALIVYSITLLICICLYVWQPYNAGIALCVTLAGCILILTIYYLIKNPERKPITSTSTTNSTPNQPSTDLPQTAEIQLIIPLNTGNVPQPQAPKIRLYYLDNLKALLTAIVVIHHITIGFVGMGWLQFGFYYNPFIPFGLSILALNQSYFMCLFFFISGYFTPSSYSRKGVNRFLGDKFKRLGLPFLVYFFGLSAILNLFLFKIATKNDWNYWPEVGPCWFVAWLLLLNVCYAFIDQNVPFLQKKFPSLIKLILIGILLGFIQLIVIQLVPGNFIFLPMEYMGALPFDLLFFIGGTMAKHNKWLSYMTSSEYHIITVRILVVICSLIMCGIIIFAYIDDMGGGMIPKKNASTDCDDDDDDKMSTEIAIYFGGMSWFSGICTMVISLGMLQFSAQYLNFQNSWTKFFSSSAYTVYIIHPLIIVPISWSFKELLYFINGIKLKFCDETISKTHFGNNGLVWFGWIYTVILSFLIVWPLSWSIKQIPGLNKIL